MNKDVMLNVNMQPANAVAASAKIQKSFKASGETISKLNSMLKTMRGRLREIGSGIAAGDFSKLNTALTSMGSKLKGVFGRLLSMKTLIAGFVLGRVAGFFKSTIELLGQQEAATNKLSVALNTSNDSTKKNVDSLKEYAAELQKVTIYGDEVTIGMMSLLATFGMNTEQIKNSTPVVQDMASALGIDLNSAAQLVGRAFAGNVGTLSRYGIVLDQNRYKAEGFSYVVEKLNGMFEGQSKAVGQSAYGALMKMSNAWGDIKERLAKVLVDSGAFDNVMRSIYGLMTNFITSIEANPTVLTDFFQAASNIITGIAAALPKLIEGLAWIISNAPTLLSVYLAYKGMVAGATVGGAILPGIGGLIGAGVGALAGAAGGAYIGDKLTQNNNINVNVSNQMDIKPVLDGVAQQVNDSSANIQREMESRVRADSVARRNMSSQLRSV